jgi:hypothetical protein
VGCWCARGVCGHDGRNSGGAWKLYSIDHANCAAPDGAELDLLARSVTPGTRAYESLRMISAPRADRIEALFQFRGAPNTTRANSEKVDYYLARLRSWKRNCPG